MNNKENLIKKLDEFKNLQLEYITQLTNVITLTEEFILNERNKCEKTFDEVTEELGLKETLNELCENLSSVNTEKLTTYLFIDFFGIKE